MSEGWFNSLEPEEEQQLMQFLEEFEKGCSNYWDTVMGPNAKDITMGKDLLPTVLIHSTSNATSG
jgi:hypothetical protein